MAEEAGEPQEKAPATCHRNRSIILCITSFFKTKKLEVPNKCCMDAQNHCFSKVMVLFAVPDVKDAFSNISQQNTPSTFKLLFSVWHTRIVAYQRFVCACVLLHRIFLVFLL
jgi:hypothetical protein